MEAAFAICVSGRLPVTPLHCVVDMRVAPENIDLFSFAEYPAASGLRSRSDYFGGVGCCGERHSEGCANRLSWTNDGATETFPTVGGK